MKERKGFSVNGVLMVVVLGAVGAWGLWMGISGIPDSLGQVGLGALVLVLGLVATSGFSMVGPNHSKVVTFLGKYMGTIRKNGFRWTYPLTMRPTMSLRVRNFDSNTLKVNDAMGNPIEIAAVIVWRVVDTAAAAFDVEDYENFVQIQTETAVRHMASMYPYDSYVAGQISLQANADEVTAALHEELQTHMGTAGVEVLRTQLRRLAYAQEIAAEMLRRQQAEAVVAARFRIVEGAVGMVDHALELLSEKNIIELDEERKAAMVSNLLVVLCSESRTQPVINAGTLYQ